MNYYVSEGLIFYLLDEIGLNESSVELGLKLSIKNNTPLPIILWSYGMLTIEELDKLYSFLFPIRKFSFLLLNNFLFIRKLVLNQMTKSLIYSRIK